MGSSVQVRDDFDRGLRDDLDNVYHDEFDAAELPSLKAYNVEETDLAYEEDQVIQYPSEVEEIEEGGAYTRVSIDPVGVKRHTVYTLKAEYVITEEALEDLRYKQMKDGVKALAVAMHRTIERRAAKGLYLGFTQFKAFDDKSVFNTSHSLSLSAGGDNPTTFSNRSQLSISPENLKARLIQFMKQRDENGDPLLCEANQIIFGPDIAYDVEQIIAGHWESGSANRTLNVKDIKGLEPIKIGHFIEAPFPNCWILRDKKKALNKFLWRKKPENKVVYEEKTGNHIYRTRARIAIGWTNWRGVDGNTGEV